jgi:hypothetical protein
VTVAKYEQDWSKRQTLQREKLKAKFPLCLSKHYTMKTYVGVGI